MRWLELMSQQLRPRSMTPLDQSVADAGIDSRTHIKVHGRDCY